MIIGSITEGLVIDHIPAGKAMKIYEYLKLEDLDCQVAMIRNASSEKYGRKDILKIASHIPLDYDLLGYIDPHITVNVIHDGVRSEKYHPQLPKRMTDVIRCKNPRCITSIEQELPHVFRLSDEEQGIYRCLYCDTRAKE
ncbi:MAG: aspartate carbamoyltransferase regulatory subunit [Eubacteriales bacterium]|nr:aspartate carbamoyltransferase regulatory subunit [Eubacteriales bacterium]